jgi:hypothetical protein
MFPFNCLMRTFNGFLLGSIITPCSISQYMHMRKPSYIKVLSIQRHQKLMPLRLILENDVRNKAYLSTWKRCAKRKGELLFFTKPT